MILVHVRLKLDEYMNPQRDLTGVQILKAPLDHWAIRGHKTIFCTKETSDEPFGEME